MPKIIGLIEDDTTMRSLLETLFKLEGYQPVPIMGTSIDAVLQEISTIEPTALLIDVHLKGFNGIDLAKEIRTISDLPQPIILMASGMDVSNQCLQAGADHFFLKPYLPETLISWLNAKLEAEPKKEE